MANLKLFTAETTATTSLVIQLDTSKVRRRKDTAVISMQYFGTWSAAVLEAQISMDGGTTWTIESTYSSSDGVQNFELTYDTRFRLEITNGGGHTLTAIVTGDLEEIS